MTRRTRLAAAIGAFALVPALGLTACSSADCDDVEWSDELTVQLTGDGDIDVLELCFRGHCMSDDDLDGSPLDDVQATDLGDGVWHFDMGMWTPDAVLVRGLAADSTVVNEYPIQPEWSEGEEAAPGCGGPATASTDLAF